MFRLIRSQLLVGVVIGAGALHAQTGKSSAQTDPRWFPWLGCWTSDSVGNRVQAGAVSCMVPVSGSRGVEQISLVDGHVIARRRIEANGREAPIENQGCNGTQAGDWAKNGRSVFVRAVYTCSTGIAGSSESIYAVSPNGEWIQVEGVRGGQNGTPLVSVDRLHDAGIPAGLPRDAASALTSRRLAIATSRAAAAGALTTDDVVEAVHRVDAPLVASWIAETGQRFSLTGQQMTALAGANVPSVVLQAMMGNPVDAQMPYADSAHAVPVYRGSAITSDYAEQPAVVQPPVYQPYYDASSSYYYGAYPYPLPLYDGYPVYYPYRAYPFARYPGGYARPFHNPPLVGIRGAPVTTPYHGNPAPQQPVNRGPAPRHRP